MTLDNSPVWLKARLMKKVKTVIKHPDGSISKGPGPARLKRLDSAYQALEAAKRIKPSGKPNPPYEHSMGLSDEHKAMGEALGMPAYEVRDIMNYDFSQANEMVMAAFKKFIMMVKLSDTVDFSESRKELKRIEEANARGREKYETECQKADEFNKNLERSIQRHRNEFQEAWNAVIEDLYRQVSLDPKMTDMADHDIWLVRAFATAVSIDVCNIGAAGKVTMDLDKAKQVSPELASKLQKNAERMMECHIADMRRAAYYKVPIYDLVDQMWTTTDEDLFSAISEIVYTRMNEMNLSVEEYQALSDEIIGRSELLDRKRQADHWARANKSSKKTHKDW